MTKTFRFRLTAWNVGFFTLLLVLFSVFLYSVLARSLVARLDDKLLSQASTAAALLEDEIREANGDLSKAAAETVFDMSLGRGAIAILSDGKPLAGDPTTHARRATRHLVVNGHSIDVISMESMESVDSNLRIVRRVIFIALPLFLLLAGIGGYLLTARTLAPLQSMAAQARDITGANLDRRLDIGGAAEEFATLAASFNELLARVDQSFDTMRRFVADASHELRTPLSVIRGEADVALTQDRSPAEYREALGIILDESRRLSRLVDDLLNLARADGGHVKLQIREFYFNELVADCCRSVHSLAGARRITLECHADIDLPFSGDEELLRRLVINLLDNAIRYTPPGGTVKAEVGRAHGLPSSVHLRISDTGIGISPDAAPHVFDRFFRADKARSRADGGFGLGLSIVKWIAESHHGAVELDSTPSEGTSFTVTLPQ
jgi:two-component system OmpR family sensor kinase